MHAGVRFQIASHAQWDPEFGTPINQEDMVFAIHTFSLEIIQGLREMRIVISDEDAENYFQTVLKGNS